MNVKFVVLQKGNDIVFIENNGDAYSIKNNFCEFMATYSEMVQEPFKRIISELIQKGYERLQSYQKSDYSLFKKARRTHISERKKLREFIENFNQD